MLLAWSQLCPHEMPLALEIVGSVMQAVIRNTMKAQTASPRTICGKFVPPELRLVESKRLIEAPRVITRCRPLGRHEFRGIVFDMDGTLTLPDQIDFASIRAQTGVPAGEDIVAYLTKLHANDSTKF